MSGEFLGIQVVLALRGVRWLSAPHEGVERGASPGRRTPQEASLSIALASVADPSLAAAEALAAGG